MKLLAIAAISVVASGAAHSAAPGDKSEQEFMRDAEILCQQEFSRRGVLNKEDFRYCMSSNKKWYAQVAAFNGQYTGQFYTRVAYPHCYSKGTRRGVSSLNQISFCLSVEIDAFKDVAYEAKRLGHNVVDPIVKQAMAKYGSWNMARYLVKSQLSASR